MKIGCLQFAPRVAEVDNNLNRADAVLSRAQQEDLDNLDLLVVPELAFTGYNFTSLEHITPYLEFAGSGISSLWARTIALKHNCVVVVGYPEKVDVSANWPTSPEFYNSAIVVNNEGETIGNYRKHFLYMIDETWALEGKGFGEDYIDGLGQTAMGICMDINPYKFEAPWHAFEFAFHVLEVQANLVIVSMAWLTREDLRSFSRSPQEPDMDTLTYWCQRMEPLIRAETEEEIIVVFCNRSGTEDDVVYAGTSAVIGIKEGEVAIYGILGRGEKNLLVVDTEKGPIGKLINRPDEEVETADSPIITKMISPITGADPFSELGSVLEREDGAGNWSTQRSSNDHPLHPPESNLASLMERTRTTLFNASSDQTTNLPRETAPPLEPSPGRPSVPSLQPLAEPVTDTIPPSVTPLIRPSNSPTQPAGSSKREKLPPLKTSFDHTFSPPRKTIASPRREGDTREKRAGNGQGRQGRMGETTAVAQRSNIPSTMPLDHKPEVKVPHIEPIVSTFCPPSSRRRVDAKDLDGPGGYTLTCHNPNLTPNTALDDALSSTPRALYLASQTVMTTTVSPEWLPHESAATLISIDSRGRQAGPQYTSTPASRTDNTITKTSPTPKSPRAQSLDRFNVLDEFVDKRFRPGDEGFMWTSEDEDVAALSDLMSAVTSAVKIQRTPPVTQRHSQDTHPHLEMERPPSTKSRNASRNNVSRVLRQAGHDNQEEIAIRMSPVAHEEPRSSEQVISPIQYRSTAAYTSSGWDEKEWANFSVRAHRRSRSANANMGLGFRTVSSRQAPSPVTLASVSEIMLPRSQPRASSRGRLQTKESPTVKQTMPAKSERSRSASGVSPKYGHLRSWRNSIQVAFGAKHSVGAITGKSPVTSPQSRGSSRVRTGSVPGPQSTPMEDIAPYHSIPTTGLPLDPQSAISPQSARSDDLVSIIRRLGRSSTPADTSKQGGRDYEVSTSAKKPVLSGPSQVSMISGPLNLLPSEGVQQTA